MLELTYKKILFVAMPLMFGTFVQSLIGITDGAFVSKLGNTAYNAVGNGSIIYIALFMLCRGISDGTQITIAKKFGENKKSEIGEVLFNAQFMQVLLSGLIFLSLVFLGEIFVHAISESKDLAIAMTDFLKFRSWGIFFAALYVTMCAFYIGLGKTRIIITATLILAVVNIFLDYSLIFGNFGFPELGMVGAPLASSISEAAAFFFLLFYALKMPKYREFNYNLKLKVEKLISKPLFKLSSPLMLQGFVALFTWLIFFSLLEHLGADNLEVAHNIRYMYFLAFVPIFGFGAATRTFVSNLVGRNERHLIPRIQKRIALLSGISILVIFHGGFLYPEFMISIVEHNPDITPEILQNSADALRFVSGSIILYAVMVVPFNSVAALGKTKLTFGIEVLAIIFYLIGCYLFIVKWQWNIIDVWWVEYIYFGVIGAASITYLYFNRLKLGLVIPN
ncbi:MAG: MATE family multidrug resistance protein [Arenicella sp.]|jgi:MATE family multidrug resistance protein